MTSQNRALPWESRDGETEAEMAFNVPLHQKYKVVTDENLRLKRLLREKGIPWSSISKTHLERQARPLSTRRGRSSTSGSRPTHPYLPMEVLLRILRYAMTSPTAIVDPLCKLRPEHLSSAEKNAGNQIAIHFLATSKALNIEGTKALWSNNIFTFTSVEALRQFGEVPLSSRQEIKHINLRIIAQYYDDQKRGHRLDRRYHPSLKKDLVLRTNPRSEGRPLERGGFRSYSWNQVADFLLALRAPFNPKADRKEIQPRLIPNLESMRIDLVNFAPDLLQYTATDFHDLTSHEFGCTLNELMLTGVPDDDPGFKATAELTGLLKDGGLFLSGQASYVQGKNGLRSLAGKSCCSRIIRSWKLLMDDETHATPALASSGSSSGSTWATSSDHSTHARMPPAPLEPGHPTVAYLEDNDVIWKRVPETRDGEKRQWIAFGRESGYPKFIEDSILDMLEEDGEFAECPCCGEQHPGSSFLEYLMDWEEDEY